MRTSASLGCCLAALILSGCQPRESAEQADTTAMQGPAAMAAPTTDEEKIQNAMAAAPDSISRAATIMDWPATEGGEFRQLRAGTNNWVCYPSTPGATGPRALLQDPLCLDPVFQQWAQAWLSKGPLNIRRVGFGYMLQGDRGASNTDPFATESTATNNWVRAGAHVMVVAPAAQLASVPATPGAAPWVMWKGTPYAHIMVPVQ